MENCPKGIENEQRIIALERDMGEIKKDIREIKDKLLGRPTWAVTIIITLLSTLAFSSLAFALTVLRLIVFKGQL